MGKAENRNRSQKTAAMLAKYSPVRTHSACPWGCGQMVRVGGPALMEHLNKCRGNTKYDRRR